MGWWMLPPTSSKKKIEIYFMKHDCSLGQTFMLLFKARIPTLFVGNSQVNF